MPFINLNPATIESDNLNIEKKNNNKKTKKTTRITDFMKDSNKQKRENLENFTSKINLEDDDGEEENLLGNFYPINNNNLSLDLSNMSSGHYNLKFETEKSIIFKQFILNK